MNKYSFDIVLRSIQVLPNYTWNGVGWTVFWNIYRMLVQNDQNLYKLENSTTASASGKIKRGSVSTFSVIYISAMRHLLFLSFIPVQSNSLCFSLNGCASSDHARNSLNSIKFSSSYRSWAKPIFNTRPYLFCLD